MGILEVGLVTVTLAAAVRAGLSWRRKRRLDDTLDNVAAKLGIQRLPDEIVGELDGAFVGARLAFDSQHEKSVARWTIYARFHPPLDLGLGIAPRRTRVIPPESGWPLATGDQAFDQAFELRADEPDRARVFVQGFWEALKERPFSPWDLFIISDEGVAMQEPEDRIDEASLIARLQAAQQLVAWVDAARGRVGPPTSLEGLYPRWSRFARDMGFTMTTMPFGLTGRVRGAAVRATTVRVGYREYRLEMEIAFERSLQLGLLVQPMRTLDRVKELFGADDQPLGDPVFDKTFLVRVSDLAGARDLFDEELRRLVLSVHHDVGPVSLMDEGVVVRLPNVPPDPAGVPAMLERVLGLATEIATRGGIGVRRGPYR